jgi:hypothetical protein
VITLVEGNWYLERLQVLRGGGSDCHDFSGGKLLLPLELIGVRSAEDVIDLLASFSEVAL